MCPGSLSCRPATRSCPALATSASSSGRWHLGGWGVRVDASSSVACTCAAAHRAAPMQVLHQDHPRRGVWPHRVGETRHLQLGWITHRHMQQRSGTVDESTTTPLRQRRAPHTWDTHVTFTQTAIVWKVSTFEQVCKLTDHSHVVESVAFCSEAGSKALAKELRKASAVRAWRCCVSHHAVRPSLTACTLRR